MTATRPDTSIDALAAAVAVLPRVLRAAMLAAVRRERIIAGAYVDADGMCPLLAAHRYGARESGGAFVEAWDRFCRVRRGRRRDATASERALLIALLQASLFDPRAAGRAAVRPAPACPVEVRA
jgi:hypothetical protein